MIDSNLLNEEISSPNSREIGRLTKECEEFEGSSDTESDISLSDKIVLESNEKRLRHRMTSLQSSITQLKNQLKAEKQLWIEDLEKINALQTQHQSVKCTCPMHVPNSRCKFDSSSTTTSIYSLVGCTPSPEQDILKSSSIQQMFDLQNYKRRLTETETMCNMELLKLKQSIEDLKLLKNIALEWGNDKTKFEYSQIEEIFIDSEHFY